MTTLSRRTTKEDRMRAELPYGMWRCADAREVLFNRRYTPIWQRYPGQPATPADPAEWVPFVWQGWFYDDGQLPWYHAPTRKRCERILAEWRGGAHV